MTPRREYTTADALDAGPFVPMDGSRAEWVRALAAGRDAGLTDDELIDLSACAPNYGGERATRAALRSIKPGAVKAGTWFYLAKQAGWKPRQGEVVALHERKPRVQQETQPTPQHTTLSPYGHKLWGNACPLTGTIGEQYLQARHCVVPPVDGALRFAPSRKHPHGDYTGPALLALVSDALTGEPISLHTTFICADGTKPAGLPGPARLLLGGHRKAGGVIRLWPDEAVTTGLCVGEGIESVLSAAHVYRPAWSAIDAGNLKGLPVLAGIESLVIAQDNDPAGHAAAHECAARWSASGTTVFIVSAATDGADLNDQLKEAA